MAQQMRELDRLTVERCGIPYATLMETAGMRVVETILEHYGSVKNKCCMVYCGKGNNGGDGAVIARLLWMQEAAPIYVFLFGRISDLKGETRTNFEIIKQISEEETRQQGISRVFFQEIANSTEEQRFNCFHCDLVIDALLGTGITRPVDG